jgi:hypothetical protein
MLDQETLGLFLGLRYFEGPGFIGLKRCEVVDERRSIIRCVAVVCELNHDRCHVLVTHEVLSHGIDISPKVLTTRRIEGERARLVRDRIKEISRLSVDDASIEFNTLLRGVLENL